MKVSKLITLGCTSHPENVEAIIKTLGFEFKGRIHQLSTEGKKDLGLRLENHLRELGSNSIATFFRNEGVPYSEVVYDVGRKVDADVKLEKSAEENERAILIKMFSDVIDGMTTAEKETMLQNLNLDIKNPMSLSSSALSTLIFSKGLGFGAYKATVVLANALSRIVLGHGLSLAANAGMTRAVGVVLGPIGWSVTGLWVAVDLASPAFRKTIPAIVQIALLRNLVNSTVTETA